MTDKLTQEEEEELGNALDGLLAYDLGATDSGIHDEALRSRVQAQLHALDDETFRLVLSRYVRERLLSEDALASGYGIEDVREFIAWLSERMEYDI